MDKQFAIFDMDGTLVNSMIYWDDIFREYLLEAGVKEDLTEALDAIRPKMMPEASAYLIQRFSLPATPESVMDRMNELMRGHYLADVEMKPGVVDYLKALKARGVKMCVASATKQPLMKICLEKQGILDYFEFLISCEDVGCGKDKPTVYYAAAKKLGARNVSDVAVYEDAFYSAVTAQKAGFYVVGIYDACAKEFWEDMKQLADECIVWGE